MRIAVVALVALTACAAGPTSTAEDLDALTCGSFCDPAQIDEAGVLEMTLSVGRWWFPDSVLYGQGSCADVGPRGRPEWECVVSLITTANPCGTIAVECLRGHCSWQALDHCH